MKYDFRCTQGHCFVVNIPMDSFTTNHRETCPECGKESERAFLKAPTAFVRMDWWDVAHDTHSSRHRRET